MSPEGLTFVVEAYAEGYAGSQSDPYVVLRSLAPITDLAVDAQGDAQRGRLWKMPNLIA